MKTATVLGIFFVALGTLPAHAQKLEWVRQFGTNTPDFCTGVSVDQNGNVFITGSTSGALERFNLGNSDAFLARYDSDGSQVWLKQFGSPGRDWCAGVAAVGSDRVLAAGSTNGNMGVAPSGSDLFVTTYDLDGKNLSTFQLNGYVRPSSSNEYGGFTNYSQDRASCVSAEDEKIVYIGGSSSGRFAVGGRPAGSDDVVVVKLNKYGAVTWKKQFGTSSMDGATGVAGDGQGNVYVSGKTRGALEGTNAGGDDIFLAKLSEHGERVWIHQIGTTSFDKNDALAADSEGNVYLPITTRESLSDVNAGGEDVYLLKFDAEGNRVWTRQIGTAGDDQCWAAAADAEGNVYLAGSTEGSLDGTNAGDEDIFLSKFNSAGDLVWTHQFGTAQADVCRGLALDGQGHAYLVGTTAGSLEGNNAGREDAFLAKFSIAP